MLEYGKALHTETDPVREDGKVAKAERNAEMLYAEIKAEESTTSVLSSLTILNQQPSLL